MSRRFLFLAAVSTVFAGSITFYDLPSALAKSACDGTITNLVKQHGGCRESGCAFQVKDNQLKKPAANMSTAAQPIEMGEGYSEIKSLTAPAGDESGVSRLRIESKAKGNEVKLSVTEVDTKGKSIETIYKLEDSITCTLLQTVKNPKGFGTYPAVVDYDSEFCSAANKIVGEISNETMKTCTDLMNKLGDTYAERADAMIKQNGLMFRQAGIRNQLSAAVGLKPTRSMGQEAFAQRENCLSAKVAFDMANFRRVKFDFDAPVGTFITKSAMGPMSKAREFDVNSFESTEKVIPRRANPTRK